MIPHFSTRLRRSFLATAALVAFSGGTAVDAAPAASGAAPADTASFVTVAPVTTLGQHDVLGGVLSSMQSLHIVVSLKLRNQAALDSFIASVTRPGSASTNRIMPPGQFAANHAPTASQTQLVTDFLTQAGFTDVVVEPNRMLVSANGSARVVESAFNTSLSEVTTSNGRRAYTNTQAVQIPASLKDTVLAVIGLQSVHVPQLMSQASPQTVTGHNPVEFSAIYGGTGVPTAANVSIGIITEGNISSSITDLNTFTTTNGLAAVTTQIINTHGTSSDTSGRTEWDLDSQDIVGVAGGVVGSLVFYNAPSLFNNEIVTAMNRAVMDNTVKIINVSLGECETGAQQDGSAAAADAILQNAVANGQTFSISTGDHGADECGDGHTTPSWPSNSQYAVAVGGTTLNTTGTTYTSETAWADGGGSPSLYEPQPSWQTGIVSGTKRGLPDVAFDGNPNSGSKIYVGSGTQQWGGTSLAAPLFSGSWARMLAAHGENLGFAAPALYQTLTASDYHDVTSGSNGGETAGPGWDFTTGFGSFILSEVVDDIATGGGTVAPVVAKAFAPSSVTAGDSSTLTITLTNGNATAATLSSDFTDTFPTGLTTAATANAATTCMGGSGVTTTSGSVTLAGAAQIPASGSCTISVDVTAASGGSYANMIPAGALQTDAGANAGIASATLTVTGGSGNTNGIITSGALNHAVMDSVGGTSLNIVTSAFDDTGATTGFDFNFWDNGALAFYSIGNDATDATQYVVDGSGNAVLLQPGDSVGPTSTFSTNDGNGTVNPVAAWLAGTDGYAGVRFNCDGRLTFPVPSTVCYGYIHITTTGTTGFPATIVDTAFDGDGNAITIVGGAPGNDPSATVTPTSLSFTVAANATATDTLNIANAVGSDPLTFTIAAQSTAKHPKLVPHTTASKHKTGPSSSQSNPNLASKLAYLEEVRNRPAATLAGNGQRSTHHASSPWVPTGSIVFQLDDGSADNFFGLGVQSPASEAGAVFINRFTATDALTIDSISIFWGDGTQTGSSMQGLQANLVVYYDADGDGDVTNAVRVGTDDLVTITTLGDFQTYTTNFSIPAAGDVYIGFVDQWALAGGYTPRIFPGAIDQTSSQGKSYLSGSSTPPTDITNLANNDLTGVIDDLSASLAGNLMIRATGTDGGSGGPCTGPVVPWLTATPASGSVNGGSNTDVTIKADPSAGTLDAGTYTAELCITTNDPSQALISVPVSLTVTAVAATPCNGGADEIFCDGFEGAPTGGNIVSGTINQPWVQDAGNGSSFDFALADFHAYDGSITTDDINLYYLEGGGSDGGASGMYVYWYGDAVPPEDSALVGGVVDAGGTDFAVLHSGATIGPDSTISAASISMANWIGGADGYIGVAFYNEVTSAVNYGYIHVTTTAPEGYPSQALEWAYDSSGAAITIP